MRKLMEMVEANEYGSVPTNDHDVEINGQGIILYEDQVAIYDEKGEYQIFLPIETWRAFVKADNKANESLNEAQKESPYKIPVADLKNHEKTITGLKNMNESLIYRLEGYVLQLEDEGNTASAASINNIIGSLQQANKLFDAAKADLGKDYEGFEDHYDPRYYGKK